MSAPAIDSMLRRSELNKVLWLKGTPTVMIGASRGSQAR